MAIPKTEYGPRILSDFATLDLGRMVPGPHPRCRMARTSPRWWRRSLEMPQGFGKICDLQTGPAGVSPMMITPQERNPLKMPLRNFPVWNFFWFTWVEGSKDQNPAIEVDSHAKPLNFILFEGFQKGEPKGNTYSKRSNIPPKAHFSSALFLPFQRVQSLSQAPRSNKIRYLFLTPKKCVGPLRIVPERIGWCPRESRHHDWHTQASSFMGQMVVFTQRHGNQFRGMVFITHPFPVKLPWRRRVRTVGGAGVGVLHQWVLCSGPATDWCSHLWDPSGHARRWDRWDRSRGWLNPMAFGVGEPRLVQ